jgi:arabinogalactan endo-1,4-beta-galactosidase
MTSQHQGPPPGVQRRTVLLGAAAATGAATLGLATTAAPAQAASFIRGADISWMPQMEANGYYWLDKNGVRRDLFTILKQYGISAVRLRTFVNPSSSPTDGHCSLDECAALAVRCKNAGFQILIDLMFGDTWNSVGTQTPPAAWASLSYADMRQAMYDYVYHAMNVLKYNSVTPAWVQIGNEINSGICRPTGGVGKPAQMTGLLMAAHDMVKQVFPSTAVVIHLAQPQNLASIQTMLNAYVANGGQWDVTGLSSYAQGGNVAGVLTNMQAIQSQYGKPVMQVEYGGPVTKPAQVRDSLKAFVAGVQGFGGLGTFYWEPEGYSPFTSYGSVAWDAATRMPTAALDGFL